MPELLTLQDLANGHLDVKALGEAANGDENTIVTTRTGNTYPSAERAINIMFKNGGLPAIPFPTKALMTASALIDGKYAMVTEDTVNNGLYVKTDGAWVKSEYDLRKLITEILSAIIKINTDKNYLLNFVDDRGLSLFRVDTHGDIYIYGTDKPLQSRLVTLDTRIEELAQLVLNYLPKSNSLAVLVDKDGLGIARFDSHGNLYLTGLDRSVQDLLLNNSEDPRTNGSHYVYSKTLEYGVNDSPFVEGYVNRLAQAKANYVNVAPVPEFSGCQSFDLNTAFIDTAEVILANSLDAPIAGYDSSFKEDVGVVHPQVWSFKEKILGYRFLMIITPYTNTNEVYEIPYLYGTNNEDLTDWTLIDNAPQPMEKDPTYKDGSYRGHLSDCGMVYDVRNGDLLVIWRESLYYRDDAHASGYDSVRARRYDGLGWSEPYYVLEKVPHTQGMVLSPNIIYNDTDDLYYMYYVNTKPKKSLKFRTSSHLYGGDWSEEQSAVFTQDVQYWHIDVKIVGDKVVMLIHEDDQHGDVSDSFYLATSSDFKNFTLANRALQNETGLVFYKGTFLPFINPDKTGFLKLMYTTDNKDNQPWRLKINSTQLLNFGV